MRQLKTLGCGLELVLWALWLGALWGLALWIAPSLFKWLPRPEAGLVAGRLFYMMSWASLGLALLLPLLALFNHFLTVRWCFALMLVVVGVAALELWHIHPHMRSLRQAIALAGPDLVPALKADFARMHAYSTTVYALKMVAVLVWGLLRYGTKKPN